MNVQIKSDAFTPLNREIQQAQTFVRPSLTYWQDAWRRLKSNRMAMIGLGFIIFMIMAAIVGPMLSPYSYSDQDLNATYAKPSAEHWFGTDSLGRDMFTRVLFGARISLSVGILAALMCVVVGIVYGGVSGFYGGRVDEIMMRIVDILYTIPTTLAVILLMVLFGEASIWNVFIAIGALNWVVEARIVRGQILALKEQEYALAAKTIGANKWRILFKHLLPNAMGPIIIAFTLAIPSAIFTEAFLSFLGLGVSAPMASWGVLASEGVRAMKSHPQLIFFPAMAISLTMLAFNFLGDGLRDALDPRLRK